MPAIKGKSRNSRNKSANNAQSLSLNRKEFILRFVKDTKSIHWAKEMMTVNRLLSIFPDPIFWNSLNLKFKLNSVCWFMSDKGRSFLNTEYKKFNLKPKEISNFEFNNIDNNISTCDIIATDLQATSKNKNLKNFLNLW